jgi:hypothetical protein
MAKKANASEKRLDTEVRTELTVEKTETVKLTVHEKAKQRKADLTSIISYARACLNGSANVSDADAEKLRALCDRLLPKTSKTIEPTWSVRLRAILGDCSIGAIKDENAIWHDYKLGRERMKNMMKDALLREKPTLRLWVTFDEETGIYQELGEGKNKPDNWPADYPVPKDLQKNEE